MVEPSEKGFIHLEIGVAPPAERFVSSAKDFSALRKGVVVPEMDMKLLAEKIIKREMKIIDLNKVMHFASGMNPGPVDIVKTTSFGDFAVEWETGNISSSHRALNKMAVGIIQDIIIGGILILPVRNLANYLTDRIGNFEEIKPYFPLYRNVIVDSGILGAIAVDFDDISDQSPIIPKGKDGLAKKSKELK